MTIYYGLIIFIGICSFFTSFIKDTNKQNKIMMLGSSISIIVIQALRKISVGNDVSGYILSLKLIKNIDFISGNKFLNYEIGYSLYSQLFSKLNVSEQVYLFIVAITIIIPISYIWSENSKNFGLSVFIYITLGFFTFSFSGLRQSIALAVTFFSFNYIKEKKLLKFLLCIALAVTFHTSAIVFIAAYPLYYLKLNRIHFCIIIPIFLMTFIFKSKIFLMFYGLYRGYEGQIELTNAYTMLLVMICALVLSYIFGSRDKKDSNFNSYKNYMLVAIFIQIFASQSNIIMRAGYYYYIFITLLIPEVIKNQKDYKIKIIAVSVLIVALLYFFQVTTGNGYLNVSPYYFYWE